MEWKSPWMLLFTDCIQFISSSPLCIKRSVWKRHDAEALPRCSVYSVLKPTALLQRVKLIVYKFCLKSWSGDKFQRYIFVNIWNAKKLPQNHFQNRSCFACPSPYWLVKRNMECIIQVLVYAVEVTNIRSVYVIYIPVYIVISLHLNNTVRMDVESQHTEVHCSGPYLYWNNMMTQ